MRHLSAALLRDMSEERGVRSEETQPDGDVLVANSTSVIEVFADIWCPFAYVGLQTVHTQCARTVAVT